MRRNLDIFSFGLLATGLLLTASLFSYDPADPPGHSVYPPNSHVRNLLAQPGAWLADAMFSTLGLGAYVLLAAWFLLAILLLARRQRLAWLRRLAGLLVLLPSAAVFAHRHDSLPLDDPAIQSARGGSIGQWLEHDVFSRLSNAGQVGVLTLALVSGTLLAFDFVFLPLIGATGRVVGRLFSILPLTVWRKRSFSGPKPRAVYPSAFRGAAAATPIEPVSRRDPAVETAPRPGEIPIRHHLGARSPSDAAELLRQQPTDQERFADFELPPLTLLQESEPFPFADHDQKLREVAALLEKTFADFHLNVKVVGINTGPVITQYEVALETGLRLNKITTLADDIALNLKVPSVRIVAPIPGKNTVGIEVPNEHRATVRLKEVLVNAGPKIAKCRIPLLMGKDTEGNALVYDLAEMPHLLIAGRTGTGKSVCMNSLILSILMMRRPDEVKLLMIDPKQVELNDYARIPHLLHPIVKDTKKAEAILAWAVDKMEERYDILSRARVRNIAGYNALGYEEVLRRLNPTDEDEKARIPQTMPSLVIIVDEVGDLMMQMKKEVEGHIIRLAQKSRAAGIHLVVATQKPTVDVITGLIKSNLPARVCFQVASRSDSRVVLDECGADKLLGKGDMLFLQPGTSSIIRAQGTYASDQEIQRVVEFLDCDPCFEQELIQLRTDGGGSGNLMESLRERDPLYEQAVEIVIREARGSVSLLQRAMGIGYGRAARLIDFMAEDGIVGGYNGSSAREVLYTPEQWDQMKAGAA
jgi:S-DNA-T family DNA segregation ATPase FtsK/SpoIIIE